MGPTGGSRLPPSEQPRLTTGCSQVLHDPGTVAIGRRTEPLGTTGGQALRCAAQGNAGFMAWATHLIAFIDRRPLLLGCCPGAAMPRARLGR